jgi:hypothetical protein
LLEVNVFFDVQEMYYLPQYEPIKNKLIEHGAKCVFVIYGTSKEGFIASAGLSALCNGADMSFVSNEAEARSLYLSEKPDWLMVGNYFSDLDLIHENTKTALVSHGIGPKSCYYDVSDSATTVRFVEGPYRADRLRQLYPDQVFIDVGYAKLDPVLNGQLSHLKPSDFGLADNKKTILYAPTFYPSSIENFSKEFPTEFNEYNVILKPHYFSMTSDKYTKQRKLLEHWSTSDNVYLSQSDEVSVLPFMSLADVLISDASSTLFEFTALNKPVVWCDFFKLRWGYRGMFSFRFKNRMDEDLYKYADVAAHAKSYSKLKEVVDRQISMPMEYSVQRQKYTMDLAGLVDGKVSVRIADYLLGNR